MAAPATNVFTTVPLPNPRYRKPSFPSCHVVSETLFSSAQLAIEDHHFNMQPLRKEGVEGGCNALGLKVINNGYPVVFQH